MGLSRAVLGCLVAGAWFINHLVVGGWWAVLRGGAVSVGAWAKLEWLLRLQ